MQGGIITGNYADYGGGVFVAQNSSDGRDNLFYMSGGSITGNNSKFDGGGVCISSNSVMKVSGGATIHNNFKNGTLSDGIYVQGSGEKNNVELDGKSITVCGALTGSIGIVEKDLYFPVNRDSIQIAVSDTSYSITQSDADKFSSDRSVYFTTYSNEDSNPVVLLRRPYIVTYDDNGATSGEVPTDTNLYYPGDTVTVAVNSGNLQKTCYTLVGWNTRADGTGVSYTSDHGTFNISSDTTLYAEWEEAIAVHEFEWIIDKDATATESGSKHEECKNCGYKKAAVEIPAIGLPAQPEDSAKPSDKETTQTGDNNSVSIYIVMILFAISGIASTIILGKKKCY
ncbi:MAG: InlB B-repeat-containing protein [Lachnospira sp.]